ncbi:hypothetical protein [Promicromonospora aerolata]|uniref:Cation-transporting ATPase n=1 Tax=Promicromonospora aerolata TaxID=195749 RepID=A0ABW4VCU1_9MICO
MSKLSSLIGLAKKVLDSQTGQQQHGATQGYPTAPQGRPSPSASTDADRQAIARYDYLMQTAEPHQIEQIHAESFARLTPAQRQAVQQRMQTELPPHEQPRSADVADLSRAAARTEARRPGSMRSVLAKVGTGGAVAGVAVGGVGVLGVVAAGAAVSSVAGPLLENAANVGVDFETLASGVDVEGLTSSLGDLGTGALDEAAAGVGDLGTGALGEATTGVEDLAGTADGALSGLGDQVSGAGERLTDLAKGFDPRDLF